MPVGSARVHQSPTSSKSHIGRVWPAMKAMTLPASSAEPPPKATTPSCWPAFSTSSPASTLLSTGFGFTCENMAAPSPASVRLASAFSVIGCVARKGSVTSSGRFMPTLAITSTGPRTCRRVARRQGPCKLGREPFTEAFRGTEAGRDDLVISQNAWPASAACASSTKARRTCACARTTTATRIWTRSCSSTSASDPHEQHDLSLW